MPVVTVESTTLATVGYDENPKRLQLEFCSRTVKALRSLWRGDDPVKPSETYEQDSADKKKPFFRVRIHNR